jgi:hypothetical protein
MPKLGDSSKGSGTSRKQFPFQSPSSTPAKKVSASMIETNAALSIAGGVRFALEPHNSHDPDATKLFLENRRRILGMIPKQSNGSHSKETISAMSLKHLLHPDVQEALVKHWKHGPSDYWHWLPPM